MAGAGPTGLATALELVRLGVRVRIFDADEHQRWRAAPVVPQSEIEALPDDLDGVDDVPGGALRNMGARFPASQASPWPPGSFAVSAPALFTPPPARPLSRGGSIREDVKLKNTVWSGVSLPASMLHHPGWIGRPAASALESAIPVVTLVFPITTGIVIRDEELDDVLCVLEAELGRNA